MADWTLPMAGGCRCGKVRFEINPQSAQRCGLKISSQLMTLGKIIKAGGN